MALLAKLEPDFEGALDLISGAYGPFLVTQTLSRKLGPPPVDTKQLER